MKRSFYFWLLLPFVYVISAFGLDALLFNQWTIDTSFGQILHVSVLSTFIDIFQCVVIFVAFLVTYALAGSSKIQNWSFLNKFQKILPLIGILIGFVMATQLWFLALPITVFAAGCVWWHEHTGKKEIRFSH